MEALRGVGAPGRTAVDVWGKPRVMALAVALALGLSGCGGGGGGGGGNVKATTPPANTTSPTNPTNPSNPSTPTGIPGGEFDVAAGQSSTVDDVITGAAGVTKGGAGTLTLTGTNLYSGATQVNAGVLNVDGDQSAATGATSVASGATLGGHGTIGGDVNIGDGGTLAPASSGYVGTLTIKGNLNLSAGSVLNYDSGPVPGGTGDDLINVKGNLRLDGTLNVNVIGGGDLGPGVHRLINYDGTLADNGLELGALPSPYWAIQTSVAHQVNLVDTRGMTFTFWDGSGPKGNGVIDGGSGTWVVNTPDASWTDTTGTLNSRFSNGAFAVFQGMPGTVTVSDPSGSLNTPGMQFASDGYVIQGDAIHLAGATLGDTQTTIRVGDGTAAGASFKATINNELTGFVSLDKADAGTLVLGGNNTYTGGTTISGGTLQVGNGGTSGSITGNVINNGTLAFDRSDNSVFGYEISGTGNLVKAGAGTLTLLWQNSYTGGTAITGGVLELQRGTPGSGAIIVGNPDDVMQFDPASILQVDPQTILTNVITLQGNGILDNAGQVAAVDSRFTYSGLLAVWNHDGGVIAGSHAGISLDGPESEILNSAGAMVEGDDYGIYFPSGGQVHNQDAGSTIRSLSGTAISARGGVAIVENLAGASVLASGIAIDIQAGGGVLNDGAGSTISSLNDAAVHVLGDAANVTNRNGATITSPTTALYLQHGGYVTNGAGSTITSTGAGSGACMGSGGCAIYVESNAQTASTLDGGVTLVNAGTIFGNVQLLPTSHNSVTLTAGGVIHGDLSIGTGHTSSLSLSGAPGTTQYYSQAVTGHTTFDGGLSVVNGAKWVIDTSDLTAGSVGVGTGSTLQVGDGTTNGWLGDATYSIGRGTLIFDRSDDLTFAGSIYGVSSEPYSDTLIKAGSGKLTVALSGYNFSPSNIAVQDGTLQIDNTGALPAPDIGNYPLSASIKNDSALVFDSNLYIDAGGVISGHGSVTKNGSGIVALEAQDTYTGVTTVNEGLLMTRYALPGSATVAQGGMIDGINFASRPGPGLAGVGGDLANAGKVAVHGGDTVVGGSYTQASTGTLAVSLGSQLAVSGSATLNGGKLEITGADSGYVVNTHTPVLTAATGLTGTFGQLVKDTGVVFTATTIHYDANSAWLDTTGLNVTTAAAGNGVVYTPTSLNSAQRVQGAFTQLNTAIASGNTSNVSQDFVQAAGQFQQAPTLQAAQASLQSVSGQLHAASAAMTFEAIDASGRALADHFDDVLGKNTAFGTWTQNLNVGGDMGRAGYDGVGFQLNGWLVGNDRQIGGNGVAGFAFGQSQGQQRLDGSIDRNRSRNTEGMLYAGWLNGNWYTQGRIGFGHFQQDVSRELLLGTSAQGVSTNYSGNYNVAYGESGLHLDAGGTRIMPFVNLEYASINRDGFTEQGAGGFGLRTNAQNIDRWQAGVGMRASHHWNLDGGRGIDFTAGAQLRRTLASHGDVFDASFVGLQQWQPLIGVGLSRYSGVLNMGLNAALSARTTLNVAYDYEKGQRDQAQTVSARVNVAF